MIKIERFIKPTLLILDMVNYANTRTVVYNKQTHSFTLSAAHFNRPKNPKPEKFFGYLVDYQNGLYQCLSLSTSAQDSSVKISFNPKSRKIILPENLENILELEDQVTTVGNIHEILVWHPQKLKEFRPINRHEIFEAYKKTLIYRE